MSRLFTASSFCPKHPNHLRDGIWNERYNSRATGKEGCSNCLSQWAMNYATPISPTTLSIQAPSERLQDPIVTVVRSELDATYGGRIDGSPTAIWKPIC